MNNKSTIRIFDRYGKLVNEMTIDKTWDGTLGGNPLPAFSIQLEDSRLFKGHFALKR